MTLEAYRAYCMAKKGVTASIPFPKLPATLVFKVGGKMFAATNMHTFASFSVRCKPETVEELRDQYAAIKEPSYFSKRHWSRIEMDGSIPDEVLRELLDISYGIAFAKLTKQIRVDISNLCSNETM